MTVAAVAKMTSGKRLHSGAIRKNGLATAAGARSTSEPLQAPLELAGQVSLISARPLRTVMVPPLIATGVGGLTRGGGVT